MVQSSGSDKIQVVVAVVVGIVHNFLVLVHFVVDTGMVRMLVLIDVLVVVANIEAVVKVCMIDTAVAVAAAAAVVVDMDS